MRMAIHGLVTAKDCTIYAAKTKALISFSADQLDLGLFFCTYKK